jgi:hypothetical protein
MDDKVQDDVNRSFWKRSLRKRFVNGRIMLRYCPSICAKGLIKTKTVGIAKWNLGWMDPRAILDVKSPLSHAAIVSL